MIFFQGRNSFWRVVDIMSSFLTLNSTTKGLHNKNLCWSEVWPCRHYFRGRLFEADVVTRPMLCYSTPFKWWRIPPDPPGQGPFLSIWMQTVGGLEPSTQTPVSDRQSSWELELRFYRCSPALPPRRCSLKSAAFYRFQTLLSQMWVWISVYNI